jgi:hypothetical protein
LKEWDFEIPNDNRPLSLLPVASKICQRVALNQLTEYLSRKKRLRFIRVVIKRGIRQKRLIYF